MSTEQLPPNHDLSKVPLNNEERLDGLKNILTKREIEAGKATALGILVLAGDTIQTISDIDSKIQSTASEVGRTLNINDVKSYSTHSPSAVEVGPRTVLLGELEYIDLYYSHREDIEYDYEASLEERASLFMSGQGIASESDNKQVSKAPIAISVDGEERGWLPDANWQSGVKDIGKFSIEALSKPFTMASGIYALDQLAKYAETGDKNGLSRRGFLKFLAAGSSLYFLDRIGSWIRDSLPRETTNINKGGAIEEIEKLLPFHDQYLKIRNLVIAQNIHSIKGVEFVSTIDGEDIDMSFFVGGGHSGIEEFVGNRELTETELRNEIKRGLNQIVTGYNNILKFEGERREKALSHFATYVVDWCRFFTPVSIKRNDNAEIEYIADEIDGGIDNAALVLLKEMAAVMAENPEQQPLNKILNTALYETIGPKDEDYKVSYADREEVKVGGATISYLLKPSEEDESFTVGSDKCEGSHTGIWKIHHRKGHITHFERTLGAFGHQLAA